MSGLTAAERERDMVRRQIEGRERARRLAWAAPGMAIVKHPERGSIVVPHASKLAALRCAAEKWGCAWEDIMDATVQRYDGNEKGGQ